MTPRGKHICRSNYTSPLQSRYGSKIREQARTLNSICVTPMEKYVTKELLYNWQVLNIIPFNKDIKMQHALTPAFNRLTTFKNLYIQRNKWPKNCSNISK